MVLSLLEGGFEFSNVEGFIRNSIPHELWSTQSGASVLRDLRDAGVAIRTQTFYNIRRQVLGLTKYEEQIASLRPERRTPLAWYVEDHGLNLSEKFYYRSRITGLDPDTGEAVTKYISITTNNELTKQQVEDSVSSLIAGEEDYYGVTEYSVEYYQALAKPGIFDR